MCYFKMSIKLILVFVVLVSSGLTRHVPRYEDLDEEDQILFRAAYDTPTYEHQDYQEEEESPGKLDLLKDGMWAIKAKVKEMKTFDKALAANLLATKLQLKELLKSHLKPLKKHHIEIEKKKPVYNYQTPAAPSYPHYETPHYSAPAMPAPQYVPAQPQYGSPQYVPTQIHYGSPPQYIPPQTQYGAPEYAPPQSQYGAPEYGPPQPQYGAPQQHDPYYGH